MSTHEKHLKQLMVQQGKFYDDVLIKAVIEAIECGDFMMFFAPQKAEEIERNKFKISTAAGCNYVPYRELMNLKDRVNYLESKLKENGIDYEN